MKILFLLAVLAGGGFYFHEDIAMTFEDASYQAGAGGVPAAGAMSEYGSSVKGSFSSVGSGIGR